MRTVSVFLISLLSLIPGVSTLIESPRRGEIFERLPSLDQPSEQRGQLVFMEHCHQCHPNGEGGLGFALNNKPLPKALIRLQVRRGFGAMPAFSEETIPDGELTDLTSYLLAIRRAGRS